MKVKKPPATDEKKPPAGTTIPATVEKLFLFYNFTAGEDPMAEMLARIKSGNVHLKKIEAATSVRQLSLQQCVYLFFITGKEEA